MNAKTSTVTTEGTQSDDKPRPRDYGSTGRSFRLDLDEVLTRMGYSFCRHINNKTRPDEPELLDWWRQILNTQVAIGALIAECERALDGGLREDAHLTLANAVARVRSDTAS